jgi:Tfp pilus assembly protein PilX
MLFIAMLFVAVFDVLTTDLQITDNHRRGAEALYIAEAGVEDAMYNLRQNANWTSDGSQSIEFPRNSGNYYTVRYPYLNRPQYRDTMEATATLADGGFQKTIRARVAVSGTQAPYHVALTGWEEH